MLKLRLCGKISSRRIGGYPVITLPIDNTANRPMFPLTIGEVDSQVGNYITNKEYWALRVCHGDRR